MQDLTKLKESINALLDLDGEEQVTKLGEVLKGIDDVSAERDQLIADKDELTAKYRQSVLNAHLPATNSQDENGSHKDTGKSWEELVGEFSAKKGQ